MAQQNIEERLAYLERKIAEYETERVWMRELTALRVGQNELRAMFEAHEEYVSNRLNDFESHITMRLDIAEDKSAARFQELEAGITGLAGQVQELEAGITGLAGQVQGLAAGQQQILELLQGGRPRTHD